jgi:hypothetical protein
VDLERKLGNKLLQIVILPLEVLDLLAGGISDRIPGETLFTRFHEFLGPGIEYARLDSLPPAEIGEWTEVLFGTSRTPADADEFYLTLIV